MAERKAEVKRTTKETDITLSVNLDGTGESSINTGIGFFDHMLTHIARHGLIDLTVEAKGDLEVDAHHTIEDVGICLGQAIDKALGDKKGLVRYGWAAVPMDEALILTAMDISGRGLCEYAVDVPQEMVGEMPVDMTPEFFIAVARNAGITLHIQKLAGTNPHHIIEAVFKCFGKALMQAVSISERVKGVPSTKGTL